MFWKFLCKINLHDWYPVLISLDTQAREDTCSRCRSVRVRSRWGKEVVVDTKNYLKLLQSGAIGEWRDSWDGDKQKLI